MKIISVQVDEKEYQGNKYSEHKIKLSNNGIPTFVKVTGSVPTSMIDHETGVEVNCGYLRDYELKPGDDVCFYFDLKGKISLCEIII